MSPCWQYSVCVGRKKGGYWGTRFLVYFQNVVWIMAVRVVGFRSLAGRCFLLPQRVAVVVCHQMGLIKLDSSFLPEWKAKLIKEGLI